MFGSFGGGSSKGSGGSSNSGGSGVSAGSGGYGSVNTNGYTCTHPHSNTSGTGVCTKNDGSSSFNYICKNTRSSSPTICKLNPSKYNYSTYHGDREGRGGGGSGKSGRDHYESKTQERFADFSGHLGLNSSGQCNVSELFFSRSISVENVTSLSLVGTKMGLNSAKYISPLLSRKNFHFSSLNLTKNQLGDEGVAYMIEGLSVHPKYFHSVTHLYLAQNRLTDTAAHYFDSWLRSGHLPYLRTLNISGNKLTHAGKSLLTKTVESVDHQIYITLDTGVVVTKTHLSFADSYRNDIYKAYKQHEIIDFSGSLGLRATKQSDVAKLLEKFTSFRSFEDIRCLSFVESNMGKNTARDFDSLLSKKSFNFDGVYLSKNQIGDLGLPHIIHALSVSPTCFHNVVKLDLSNNGLTDISAKLIAKAIGTKALPGLKTLHLEGNKFSSAGESYLAVAVNKAPNDTLGVIVEKHTSSAGVWNFIKKAFNYYAQEHYKKAQANDKAALAIYGQDDWAHCKKLVADASQEMSTGFVKYSSYTLVQQALQKSPSQLKTGVVAGVFIASAGEAALNVNVENLVYCAAAINKNFGIGVIYHPDTPDSSVGFIGNNEEFVDDF